MRSDRWGLPALLLATWLLLGGGPARGDLRLDRPTAATGPVIVLPAGAPVQAEFAAAELQKTLAQIFGAAYPLRRGPVKRSERAIVLQPAPPGPASPLGEEGYRLTVSPGRLTIAGGLPRGIIYGAYAALERYFGCRWLAPECAVIPARRAIVLRDGTASYVPPLPYRDTNSWSARDAGWALHQHLNGASIPYDPAHGWTNRYEVQTFDAMDPLFADHPEFFALVDGKRTLDGQLCFSNPEGRRRFRELVLARLRTQPVRILSIPQRERGEGGGSDSYCHCAACQAIAAREGSQSGPLLDFINDIAGAVAAEFPETFIQTEAYQWSLEPPARLHAAPNVIIQLCPIDCAYNLPLEHPINARFQRQIAAWSARTDHIFIWDYTINFWHLLAPHPNFRVFAPNIRFYLRHHASGVFEQSNNFHPAQEFSELRAYLLARALWNPQTDTERDIDDFVAGFYGAAAPMIRAYITRAHDSVRDPAFYMGIYNGCTCDSEACRTNHALPPRWPPDMLHALVALFDRAEQAVAADPVRLRRVERARLPLLYKQICGEYMNCGAGVDHDPALTREALGRLIDRFETLARREGVTCTCEFSDDDTGSLDVYLAGLKAWYVKQ